jgi:heterodisulfide reductase subunit B2
MNYLYFPGCSLKGSGKAYEESFLAVCKAMGVDLTEIEDWNCCGATAYMAVNELNSFALTARNLAIAEKHTDKRSTVDLIAPCAACYLVLTKTQKYLAEYEGISSKVNQALNAAGLTYEGRVKIRHPLDVFTNDIGIEKVKAAVKKPLTGLKVACYYGCQIVRPFKSFDNKDNPMSMDQLLRAMGAETIDWPLKTRCCSGSLTGTIQEVGMRLSYIILREAQRLGADIVATACPLCQFNLECYQKSMTKAYEDKIDMPVAYFTQLMGMAYGIEKKELGMQRLFVPPKPPKMAKAMKGAGNAAR